MVATEPADRLAAAGKQASAYSFAPVRARHATGGDTAAVAFVVDDLVAWLVGLLADAGRKKLTALVLGSDQERALGRAATAAIQLTVTQLAPPDDERAEQLAMVVSEVFRGPPGVALAGQGTLLEALQAGIAAKLAVLDDPGLTGTGQSSAEGLGVSGSVLAEALAGHLIQEIMLRGSAGGPLAPLADQLNHDVTHLQGQRIEGVLAQLVEQVMVLGRAGSRWYRASQCGWCRGRRSWPGGRTCWPTWMPGWAAGRVPGRGWWRCTGWEVRGKPAWRWSMRTGTWAVGVTWQFSAEDAGGAGGRVHRAGRQHGRPGRGPGIRWRRCTGRWPRAPGVAAGIRQRSRPGAVAGFVPPVGDGRVLITSRNALWPPGQGLEVPVLDAEAAVGFLVDRAGDRRRAEAARPGRGELGGLPLALEQAAAYAQATGNSLAAYLALFHQRRADLLARGQVLGYGGTVATTWALAFGQLQDSAPEAAGLLRLLACCAPEAIPLRLLLRPPPGLADQLDPEVAGVLASLLDDELAAGDAIAALRRYSLVRPAGDGAVSVHRLVQAVTADQMPGQLREAWRQAAATLVEAALPHEPRQPDTWPVFAALLPHAQAVLPPDNRGMERHRVLSGVQRRVCGCTGVLPGTAGGTGPGAGPRTSEHPGRPRSPRFLDRQGRGCGRGTRPVRRAAAHHRASTRPRAPLHPGRSRHPRPLHRGGRRCGRGTRPVRRAAAHQRASTRP